MTTMKRLIFIICLVYIFTKDTVHAPSLQDLKRTLSASNLKPRNKFDNMVREFFKIRHKFRNKKELNKSMHILEGNKLNNKLKLGWWNNKSSQCHTARNTRNEVAQVIRKYNLDILSISEANVYKEQGYENKDRT